jgi:integrase
MGTINEREDQNGNTRFQAIIRIKGHPTQTETFSTLTHAKRWIQQEEAAIREGRNFKLAESKKHTLGEMIDRYIKQFNPPAYKQAQLIWWKTQLGHCLLYNVTPSLIAEGRDELLQGMTPRGRRTPSTAVRYIAALSHIFTVGIKEFGWIETSPVSKIMKPREPAGRVRFLNDEERERLLQACKNHRNPVRNGSIYCFPLLGDNFRPISSNVY